MEIALGTTNREISFKNRQTGRSKVIPAGQKVSIRNAFAQGNGYVLKTTHRGDAYETQGVVAAHFTRDND